MVWDQTSSDAVIVVAEDPNPSEAQILGELRDLSMMLGGDTDRLLRVVSDVLRLLRKQTLLLSQWSDNAAPQLLEALLSGKQLHVEEVFSRRAGRPSLLQEFVAENRAAHHWERTRGAAGRRSAVQRRQRGAFCCLCGRRDGALTVEHMTPVSRGGDARRLSNLQLLCASCNSAKKDLTREQLVRDAIAVRTSVEVPARLRVRVLLDSATREDGVLLGTCSCGRTARTTLISVVPLAGRPANFLSVRRCCAHCET